jgi:proteic killer suppression protein
VILGFRHKGLKRFYEEGDCRGLRPDMTRRLGSILTLLEVAKTPGDLASTGFRLHPLKGELTGCWSLTVNANWRVVFRFRSVHVDDVDLVDYH